MFVNDKCIFPNKGASKLIKFLISNWSNGLVIVIKKEFIDITPKITLNSCN